MYVDQMQIPQILIHECDNCQSMLLLRSILVLSYFCYDLPYRRVSIISCISMHLAYLHSVVLLYMLIGTTCTCFVIEQLINQTVVGLSNYDYITIMVLH